MRTLFAATSALFLIAFVSPARADENLPATPPAEATKTGASIGMALHRFQDDFGLGLTLSSPTFARLLRVTGAGGLSWFPHGIGSDGGLAWETLYYGSLVIETGPPFFANMGAGAVRPYGFGGVIALFAPSSLSSTSANFGGIGGFGLEARFFNDKGGEGPVTYFFQVGGIGTGAKADKLATKESIASGFLVEAGLRFYP